MPGSRLYNFTLKQPQFEITPFQAVAFEPKEKENIGLLNESFNKIEERRKSYDAKHSELVKMFGDMSDKLVLEGAGSEEQVNWWNNFQNNYLNSLEEWANSGDLSSALEMATTYGAEAYANKELHARMKASEKYRNYIKEAEQKVYGPNQTVSKDKYLWWRNTRGAYRFNPIEESGVTMYRVSDNDLVIDENGDYIYDDMPFYEPLYDDFNPMQFGLLVEKLINPDSETSSDSRSSERASYKDGSGSSSGSSWSHETSETKVDYTDIINLEKAIEFYMPDMNAQLQQDYDFLLDRYKAQQQKINYYRYPGAYLTDGQPILSEDGNYYATNINEDGTYEWLPITDATKVPSRELENLEYYGKTLLGPNGNILSFQEYKEKNVFNEAIAKALAYKNTVRRDSKGSSRSSQQNSHGGGGSTGATGNNGGNYGSQPYVPQYDEKGAVIATDPLTPIVISLSPLNYNRR